MDDAKGLPVLEVQVPEVQTSAEGASDPGRQYVKSPGTDDNKSDTDDSESDVDYSQEDSTPNHTSLQDIVTSIKAFEETDWADTDTQMLFGEDSDRWPHLGVASETTGDRILHILMTESYANKAQRANLGKAIQCTIQYRPNLWTERNEQELTPLYLALSSLNTDRVNLLKKHLFLSRTSKNPIPRVELERAIATKCPVDRENCLHLALKHRIYSTSLLTSMIKYATPEAINATDENNWTPLHRAARYDLSSEGSLKIIKALIARGEVRDGVLSPNAKYALDMYVKIDKEYLSVYQYHMKTREKTRQLASSSRQANKPSRKESSKAEKNSTRGPNRSIGNSHQTPTRDKANMGATRTVPGVAEELKDEELRKPSRSGTFNVAAEAAATDSKKERESRDKDQAKEKLEQYSELIRSELKLHCLRTRTFSQAVRFLYGLNPDGMLTHHGLNATF